MAVPTDDDQSEALRRLLTGMRNGDAPFELIAAVTDLHIRRNTFPGEVFLQLGADALALAGINSSHKVNHENLLATHLGEIPFKGKDRERVHYALMSTFAVHGGLEVDLLEEVHYWVEDYWRYALFATVAVLRICADLTSTPIAEIATALATQHNVNLDE